MEPKKLRINTPKDGSKMPQKNALTPPGKKNKGDKKPTQVGKLGTLNKRALTLVIKGENGSLGV